MYLLVWLVALLTWIKVVSFWAGLGDSGQRELNDGPQIGFYPSIAIGYVPGGCWGPVELDLDDIKTAYFFQKKSSCRTHHVEIL